MTSKKNRTQYQFHGVTMPTSSHPTIRKLKRQDEQPALHGNKLWKSSFLLIDYLHRHRPEHSTKVLDVGCGWGISGIWCAKALGAQVTSVDADRTVFPYLDAVAHINQVQTKTQASRFEKLTKAQLAQFDILVAADICFWDELVKPVSNMIDRAVDAGVKQILIADPERSSFLTMAEGCVEKHCAELFEWQTTDPIAARGALLLIENA